MPSKPTNPPPNPKQRPASCCNNHNHNHNQSLLQQLKSQNSYHSSVSQFTGTMSRRHGSVPPKLDLKLHLSPPAPRPNLLREESPSRSATVSPTSPPSSCVSSEMSQDGNLGYSSSPEATSMLLVGCPNCLMYVMLSEGDPKCPRCKSTVLLDFLHDNTPMRTRRN